MINPDCDVPVSRLSVHRTVPFFGGIETSLEEINCTEKLRIKLEKILYQKYLGSSLEKNLALLRF